MKNRFICFITLLFIIVTLIGTRASCTNKKIQVVDPENGDSSTDFMCRIKNSNQPSGYIYVVLPCNCWLTFIMLTMFILMTILNSYGGAYDNIHL